MKIKSKKLKRKSRTNWFSQSTYAEYGHVYLPEGVVTIFLWSGSEPRASFQTSVNGTVYSVDMDGHYSRDKCVKLAKEFMHEVSKMVRISVHKSSPSHRRTNLQDPGNVYRYALRVIHGRYEEGESVLAQDAKYSYRYAMDVIKGRFFEGEAAIAQSPEYAYRYARDVIGDRFPEGEEAIAQKPTYAIDYARYILQCPFPAGEDAISKCGFHSYQYASIVLIDRFPAGEDAISKHKVYSKIYDNWLQSKGID